MPTQHDRLDGTSLSEQQKKWLRASDAVLLDPPYLDRAICGVGEGGNAVYDYWALVFAFAEHENMTQEEAQEWVEYNTIRALPYMPHPTPEVSYGDEP